LPQAAFLALKRIERIAGHEDEQLGDREPINN
jgi:hypothetical protein